MINSVNFNPVVKVIKNISFKGNNPVEAKTDVFIKSDNAKLEQAKETARKTILKHMENDDREYGFILSNDGRILSEMQGTENSCNVDRTKLENDCIGLHGHPKKAPLSPKDIALLLCSNMKSVEAIAPDGQISRMTKTTETPNVDEYTILKDLSDKICLKILDELGIDYSVKEEDLTDLFKKYLSHNNISCEDDTSLLNEMIKWGIYDGKDMKKAYKSLCAMMALYDSGYINSDKEETVIRQNKDLIEKETYTPLGIRIGNEFLKETADKYKMKYETNMA